jgi:uncharacterized membrane protein YkvA (DUF1232 family)
MPALVSGLWTSHISIMDDKAEFMGLPVAHRPPDERRFWAKLKRVLAEIPFAEDLVAAYYCARDPATPGYVRGVLLGAIAYFLRPVYLVPDLIAGLGFTDDASVIAAVIAAIGGHLQPQHRRQARARLRQLSD